MAEADRARGGAGRLTRPTGTTAPRRRRRSALADCCATCSQLSTGARSGRSGGRSSSGSGRTPDELRDEDTEAIGDLVPADDVPLEEVRSPTCYPLRFPPQQHKLGPGIARRPRDRQGLPGRRGSTTRTGSCGSSAAARRSDKPLPRALIPPKPIPQTAQQDAAARARRARVRAADSADDAALRPAAARPPRLAGAPPVAAGRSSRLRARCRARRARCSSRARPAPARPTPARG